MRMEIVARGWSLDRAFAPQNQQKLAGRPCSPEGFKASSSCPGMSFLELQRFRVISKSSYSTFPGILHIVRKKKNNKSTSSKCRFWWIRVILFNNIHLEDTFRAKEHVLTPPELRDIPSGSWKLLYFHQNRKDFPIVRNKGIWNLRGGISPSSEGVRRQTAYLGLSP